MNSRVSCQCFYTLPMILPSQLSSDLIGMEAFSCKCLRTEIYVYLLFLIIWHWYAVGQLVIMRSMKRPLVGSLKNLFLGLLSHQSDVPGAVCYLLFLSIISCQILPLFSVSCLGATLILVDLDDNPQPLVENDITPRRIAETVQMFCYMCMIRSFQELFDNWIKQRWSG